MATKYSVEAEVSAKDKASPEIAKAEGSFKRFSNFLSTRFVVTLGDVSRLFAGMGRAVRESISDFLAAEKAIQARDTALRASGALTADLVASLNDQASAMQRTTKFTEDQTIATQAFLTELGVSGDQLELATRASADLAEAFGIDLTSAARNVGKTVGGFAGELGELIPELKDLSAEALQSGEGIELLAEKFEGRATEAAKTLAVQIQGLQNDLDDLGKVFVRGALGTDETVEAFEDLRKKVQETSDEFEAAGAGVRVMSSFLTENKAVALGAAGALGALGLALAPALTIFAALGGLLGLTAVGLGKLEEAERQAAEATGQLTAKQEEAFVTTEELWKASQKAASGVADVGDAAAGSAGKLDAAAKAASGVVTQFEAFAAASRVLGQTTSVELENQILQINLALEAQKAVLGETSPEFQRLAQTAEAQIELIEERVRSLRDGLGDVVEAVDDEASAIDRATGSVRDYNAASRTHREELRRHAEQAGTTAAAMERLADANRQAAATGGGGGGGTLNQNLPNGRLRVVQGVRGPAGFVFEEDRNA